LRRPSLTLTAVSVAEVRTEIAGVRTEIAGVRTEIAGVQETMIKWFLTTTLALVAAVFAVAKFFH